MATIKITVLDSEKKSIEQLFNNMSFTASSATRFFYKQALNDNFFPFTTNISFKQNSRVIRPKISNTGALIVPDDAPQDVKDWVDNG